MIPIKYGVYINKLYIVYIRCFTCQTDLLLGKVCLDDLSDK